MRKRKYLISFVVPILCFFIAQTALTYHADLHPIVTGEAVDKSKLTQTDYLKTELGFTDGLTEEFRGPGQGIHSNEIDTKNVRDWIIYGSWKEDKPMGPLRAQKHFYDPVNETGLTDHPFTPGDYSALQRARDHTDDGEPYSWADARRYYYLALTSATKEERDENFAKTFRALGQIIHLLEDMAVPAHTRNDNHFYIPPGGSSVYGQDMYEHYCTPDAPLIYEGYPVVEYVKLNSSDEEHSMEKFWDTNIGSATFGKGLAEYTNHNFVSRDTNLDVTYGIHNYVYPFKTGEHREDFTFQDRHGNWRTVRVTYIHTNATDNYDSNESVIPFEYLTVYSFFNCYTEELGQKPVYTLNRKCHEEYGKLLLPRAAGYSAGLLNYFFRGKLDVEGDIPDTIPRQYKLTITNRSGEKMVGGTLDLYYENEEEEWLKVPDFSSNYGNSLEAGGRVKATFTIPLNFSWNAPFTLVFRGKLGQEENAVIGKVFNLGLINNCVDSDAPDETYITRGGHGQHFLLHYYYCPVAPYEGTYEGRIFFAYPEGYDSLSIWNTTYSQSLKGDNPVEIYEVDLRTFDITTVTWNTRPELGRLIEVKNFSYNDVPPAGGVAGDGPMGWHIINITGTQGVCLVSTDIKEIGDLGELEGSTAIIAPIKCGSSSEIEGGRSTPHLGYPVYRWTDEESGEYEWIIEWKYGPWPPVE